MPDTNDRVMAMVEKELQADPGISNEALRAKAQKLDDSVAGMSARQFNARYPLQVKRRLQPRAGRKAGKRSAAARKAGRKPRGAAAAGARRGRPPGGGRKAGRAAGSGKAAAGGDGRDATERGRVRAALLDFARDLASADGAGLVDVIAGVDGYVERVMKATRAR